MKKVKNKEWIDKHAKIKHRHELKRRYRYNQKYFAPSRESYKPYGSEEYYQSVKAKKRFQRKLSKNSFQILEAPENFSIFANPEQSLSFFSDIEDRISFGDPVYFEMKEIQKLSIDTIMYFLAIIKRIKSSKVAYGFKGSVPSDKKCRDLLESSGFFKYVNAGRMKKDLTYASEVVQIENGERADCSIARKICDFTMSKLNLKRVEIRELYVMIIELMTNTKQPAYVEQHAYRSKRFSVTDWYVFVRFVAEKKIISFIFLDTGHGIPATVKRKILEPKRPILGFGSSHTELIRSTLEGRELRSRTGELYRGKGLPKIYSYYKRKRIDNLTIISNQGYFEEKENDDMEQGLKGTLFYWELSKES
jgi:hypothetical protein